MFDDIANQASLSSFAESKAGAFAKFINNILESINRILQSLFRNFR